MRRLPWILVAILVVILMVVIICCRRPSGPDTGCQPGNADDYFPYTPSMVATFDGTGNEFASFVIRVLYRESNLVEWRLNNGGTEMAEVFSVQPSSVKQVYAEGEAYDANKRLTLPPNRAMTLLQNPVATGTTWTSEGATYRILSTNETVAAAGKNLTCVVSVEAAHENTTITRYYHKQHGMVLSVFRSNDGTAVVESRLASITTP